MPKAQTKSKGMHCTKDSFGKEILLNNEELQVMMEWERPYMEACIETLKPKGDVLEIGFGLGYSANAIQKHKPKSHTIIESDPQVIAKAKEWAKSHPNTKILTGRWQELLPEIGFFDTIFFDDYMPLNPAEAKQVEQETQESTKMLQKIDSLKAQLSKALQRFEGVKFSDADLKNFLTKVMKQPDTNIQDVISFADTMVKLGNITPQQKEAFLKELKPAQQGRQPSRPSLDPLANLNHKDILRDHLIDFIELCLNDHMKPGAKLSAYIGNPESKKKNKEFERKILSRKDVRYTEKEMPITVAPNCDYYSGNKALIILIERK
jgi:hypothetical protein